MPHNAIRNLLAYSEIIEKEMQAVRKAEIWPAALTLACSLVESHLLMRAISSIEQIHELSEYSTLSEADLCGRKWGLEQLTKLAHKLGWLDVNHIKKEIVDALVSRVQDVTTQPINRETLTNHAPWLLIQLAKNQRNTVHPGKIARLEIPPQRTAFLEAAEGHFIFMEVILRCLRETQNYSSLD